MIINDCNVGDIIWIFDTLNKRYIEVEIVENIREPNDKTLMPQQLVKRIEYPYYTEFIFVNTQCWKECPKEKPKLKYHNGFRELWDRFKYPEYQEYQDKPGFDDNSVYDVENNTYFIKVNWLKSL